MDFIPNPIIIPVGIIIGFLVAAPVGPVNLLCIHRTIETGFLGGIGAIFGAVLGDGLIALFAAFGVGAISGAVEHHRLGIQIVGGAALIFFGIKLFIASPRILKQSQSQKFKISMKDFIWDVPQTFFLTISNPGAVLGLFAIFGGISSFVEVHSKIDAITIVASIMAGSLTWWFILSSIISRFRYLVDAENLKKINKIASLILVGFGMILITEIFFKFDVD